MTITAKFDLEITQIDTVNAFVYCDFNKVIYIKLPPRFNKGKKDKVLCLKKSPVWTIIITTVMAEEFYKLIE